jgi:hypothetical protein
LVIEVGVVTTKNIVLFDEVPDTDVGVEDEAISLMEFVAHDAALSFKDLNLDSEIVDSELLLGEKSTLRVVLNTEEVVHKRSDEVEVRHGGRKYQSEALRADGRIPWKEKRF